MKRFLLPFVFLGVCLLTACAAADPDPGVVLRGSIDTKNAASATISLKVSEDGGFIESISLGFTDLKCEGFSAGSYSTMTSMKTPITDGTFTITGEFGEVKGSFTSGSSAKGTIHLALFDGKAECGTADWSAKGD